MKKNIKTCLWFNNQAEEAVGFYTGIFNDSRVGNTSHYGKEGFEQHGMPEGTLLTAEVQLAGRNFLFLNGGPAFTPNPSVSFFVVCDSAEEVDHYWDKLKEDGNILMPLDKYEWSERYAWVQDKYGINWQLIYGKFDYEGQKIVPALMFTGENVGKAEEAMKYYTSLFENSSIRSVARYMEGEKEQPGIVKHAQFNLGSNVFAAMDSSFNHGFTFNEAISFVVECDTQEEIDRFWTRLTDGGEESMCGWLKDRYGLSWQVVPSVLGKLMSDPDKAGKVTQAFMQMNKFEIDKLINA